MGKLQKLRDWRLCAVTIVATLGGLLAFQLGYGATSFPPAGPPMEVAKQLDELLSYPTILTFDRPEGRVNGRSLIVTSSTFVNEGMLPARVSGHAESVSPQVTWTAGPAGTKSYVLFFEDSVSNRMREGTLHWLAFNIPFDVSSLPEGLSVKGIGLRQPIGTMREGANVDGTVSYLSLIHI